MNKTKMGDKEMEKRFFWNSSKEKQSKINPNGKCRTQLIYMQFNKIKYTIEMQTRKK